MLILLLVFLGVLTRLLPHMSQFTAMLAVAFLAGLYLKGWKAIVVPLLLMVVSDLIIGFHDTMFFTWGSMVLISCLGVALKDRKNLLNVFSGSVLAACIFFVVTNIGAWLSLYPHTMAGLRECYIMAVPFFRTTLASTVAYTLVLYVGYEWVLKRSQGTSLARLL